MRQYQYVLGMASILFFGHNSAAQDVELTNAIALHAATSLEHWQFERVSTTEGRTTSELCLGVGFRVAECQLIYVNGMSATEAEIHKYQKSVKQPVKDNLPNVDLGGILDNSRVPLEVDTSDDQSRIIMHVVYDKSPKKDGYPVAELTFDHRLGIVKELERKATKRFSLIPGVSIHKFILNYTFDIFGSNVFATSVQLEGAGRAFGLKRVTIMESTEFRNFKRNTSHTE